MRTAILLIAAAVSLGALDAMAAGSSIPPGRYACNLIAVGNAGYVDIRGSDYRGPSLTPGGSFSPYSMAGNAITWSAGFGEFNVDHTQYRGLTNGAGGHPWFTVTYRRTRGGGVDTVDCEREP